jgi:uncharacterized protein
MTSVSRLAEMIRSAPAMQAKRELSIIRRLAADIAGDDAAAIEYGGEYLIVAGEAIVPTFVQANPHAAGAAAVITNVSDVRAMGARPLGLVDMLVSPTRELAEIVLDGIGWAAQLLGVDVVGGHLTLGHSPALSASCTGVARRPLLGSRARPGDVLLVAFSLEGRYTDGTPYFSSLRDRDPESLRDDGEALVEVADHGLAHAARDISMPGVAGSLLQMLEATGCGATLALEPIPRPPGVELARWLVTFPSFGYVLTAPPERAQEATEPFVRRGLACQACGRLDGSGVLRLEAAGDTAAVWDLTREPFTHLQPGPGDTGAPR